MAKNKFICVFQASRPYLGFCPDPKHFIVSCNKILSNVLKMGENVVKNANFCIKYFDKIK